MDRTGIVLRDKRIAELMEMVSEQQRVIVALQAWNEKLQHEVEELRRELRAMATGKPKGMPGNKRGAGKAAKSGAEGEPKQERKKREQNFARPRGPEPTARVEHAVGACPSLVFARPLPEGASYLKCQTTLTHGTVYRTREVIEVVPNPAISSPSTPTLSATAPGAAPTASPCRSWMG